MSLSQQQRSTLEFFRNYAPQWRKNAEKAGGHSVILQRNGVVMRVAEEMGLVSDFLDAGCGTGELVLDMAEKGAASVGVDLAPGMIMLCEEKRDRVGVKGANFENVSVFDFKASPNSFDLISAQGFVEYISPEEFDHFLDLCREWLRPGGRLVASIRNRLFNLLSLNDFTRMELTLGATEALYREAIAIASTGSMEEAIRMAVDAGFDQPPPDEHPITGVPIKPRYQFTPSQIIRQFGRHGLEATGLYAVHYHAFPPAFAQGHPELHGETAQRLFELACEDPRTIPAASTFVLAARKT